jgi:hypothetical protein
VTLWGLQDSASACPAYIIRYRREPGAGPLEAQFPAPAGPDSLMARGEAAFRAHLQPAFDAAAAAFAAAAAAAALAAGGGGAAGRGGGAADEGGAGPDAAAVPAAAAVIDLTGESD